jgi:predicted ABC-type exoprotein transport system permease subunit
MHRSRVVTIVAVLLVAWLAVSVVGAVVRGLFWLTVVGVVLFVGTAAYGYLKRGSGGRSPR